jgi:hypothetical protein
VMGTSAHPPAERAATTRSSAGTKRRKRGKVLGLGEVQVQWPFQISGKHFRRNLPWTCLKGATFMWPTIVPLKLAV